MKCYKCNGKIALVMANMFSSKIKPHCLPCIYFGNREAGKQIMPFLSSELEKIRDGTKWTSLRSAVLKYETYPFELSRVYVRKGFIINDCGKITDEVVRSEGFNTFDELITSLTKKGFLLPQEFWLFDLRKPIK